MAMPYILTGAMARQESLQQRLEVGLQIAKEEFLPRDLTRASHPTDSFQKIRDLREIVSRQIQNGFTVRDGFRKGPVPRLTNDDIAGGDNIRVGRRRGQRRPIRLKPQGLRPETNEMKVRKILASREIQRHRTEAAESQENERASFRLLRQGQAPFRPDGIELRTPHQQRRILRIREGGTGRREWKPKEIPRECAGTGVPVRDGPPSLLDARVFGKDPGPAKIPAPNGDLP